MNIESPENKFLFGIVALAIAFLMAIFAPRIFNDEDNFNEDF